MAAMDVWRGEGDDWKTDEAFRVVNIKPMVECKWGQVPPMLPLTCQLVHVCRDARNSP